MKERLKKWALFVIVLSALTIAMLVGLFFPEHIYVDLAFYILAIIALVLCLLSILIWG